MTASSASTSSTTNHVHLLMKDTGGDVITQSMQLIAGRTAQEYHRRKNRNVKSELGSKAMHREVEQFEGTHVLREASEVYGFKSAVFWNESFEDART